MSIKPKQKQEQKDDRQIVDISEDDMRQFEKLVVKSENLDVSVRGFRVRDGYMPQGKRKFLNWHVYPGL